MIGTLPARRSPSSGSSGWLDDGLRPIGCACEIAEVLEELEDGRINPRARDPAVPDRGPPGRALYRPAPSSSSPTATRSSTPRPRAWREAYAELVRQATDRTPDPAELAAMSAYRWPRPSSSAWTPSRACSTSLGDGSAEARRAAVPGRREAAGLRRARAGPRALERQGALRGLTKRLRGATRGWSVTPGLVRRRRRRPRVGPPASGASKRSTRFAIRVVAGSATAVKPLAEMTSARGSVHAVSQSIRLDFAGGRSGIGEWAVPGRGSHRRR